VCVCVFSDGISIPYPLFFPFCSLSSCRVVSSFSRHVISSFFRHLISSFSRRVISSLIVLFLDFTDMLYVVYKPPLLVQNSFRLILHMDILSALLGASYVIINVPKPFLKVLPTLEGVFREYFALVAYSVQNFPRLPLQKLSYTLAQLGCFVFRISHTPGFVVTLRNHGVHFSNISVVASRNDAFQGRMHKV
jgi:hypothetical protein